MWSKIKGQLKRGKIALIFNDLVFLSIVVLILSFAKLVLFTPVAFASDPFPCSGECYSIGGSDSNDIYVLGGAGTGVAGSVTVTYSSDTGYATQYTNSEGQIVSHWCECAAGCCGGAEAAPAPAPAPVYVPPPPGPGVDPGCQGACG